jgi:Ca-activated chloride channel family protein
VIFLTDGAPTVGKTNEKDILADTKEANKVGARLFAFGVGYQPNVRLLDKLVDQNDGRSDYVRPKEPVEAKVSSLYNKIKNPVMTDLKVKLQGVRLKDMYPRKLGDLFDGDQIVVVGRYDCRDVAKLPKKGSGAFATTLVVKGIYQGNEKAFEYNVGVRKPGKDMRYVFVEKIWAIRRVGWLLDEIQLNGKSKEVIDELIRLSQTYGIMTPYTSFLADDRGRVASAGDVRREAKGFAKGLARAVNGEAAQRGAVSRRMLNDAAIASAATEIVNGRIAGVAIYGNTTMDAYEKEKVEYVAGLRNVGNLALYRRGRVWMTTEAAKLDPKKDADKITTIKRYSKAYFELARRNTVAENQVMASQRANEELMLKLRKRMYLVK